jgi:hypothetical protein
VPVSMILPPKVSRTTIAAPSLGSVKVSVQQENDSLEEIATEFFSSRSVSTWNSSSAPWRSSSMKPSSSIYADILTDRSMSSLELCRLAAWGRGECLAAVGSARAWLAEISTQFQYRCLAES